VLERSRGAGLYQQPLAGLGQRAQMRGEELEGDVTVEQGVVCPVHHPHSPAAESAPETVVADLLPNGG
jgi:hypothetical protein